MQVHLIKGQILSNDTIACNLFEDTLYALGSALSDMQSDDLHDEVVDIGFPFTFYGNVYNQLVISGNGYVTFDLSVANSYSPWPINTTIPNPGSQPENAIMSPWHDINTGAGGQVFYGMSGIAPNRFFVITWCKVPMFSCSSDLAIHQVILHEGSNKIEIFIDNKPLCSGWNSGAAVLGLVDATSTNTDIVFDPVLLADRNYPLQWTATNEGWEFIPNGTTDYNINQITYIPIDVGINYWLNSLGVTIGVGPTLAVSVSSTTTFYSEVIGDCYTSLTQDSITITITNPVVDLGLDYNIACNTTTIIDPTPTGGITPYTYSWSTGSNDTLINVGGGIYTLDIIDGLGCLTSDNIEIIEDPSPSFNLGLDYNIACNTTTLLDPVITGGSEPYSYNWNIGSTDSSLLASDGLYILIVTDLNGCLGSDTITITEDISPTATITGGGAVCDDGTTVDVSFSFNGLLPWDLTYTNGTTSQTVNNIPTNTYLLETSAAGQYDIEVANDINDCIADIVGASVDVIINPMPVAQITPNDITLYIGDEIDLTAGEYTYYEWYNQNDTLLSTEQILTVTDSGLFYIWVEDENGCTDISELATVRAVPLTQLFIPTVFTPNDDDHNEFFVIKGLNVVTFNIQIFTRWGELVFESNSIDKYWDGSFENNHVSQGSYYYNIEVLGKDRKSFSKGGVIQVIY